MIEGDVVMVTGNLSEIRNQDECRVGTAILVTSKQVMVLLSNGDIWVGPKHYVFKDQATNSVDS